MAISLGRLTQHFQTKPYKAQKSLIGPCLAQSFNTLGSCRDQQWILWPNSLLLLFTHCCSLLSFDVPLMTGTTARLVACCQGRLLFFSVGWHFFVFVVLKPASKKSSHRNQMGKFHDIIWKSGDLSPNPPGVHPKKAGRCKKNYEVSQLHHIGCV